MNKPTTYTVILHGIESKGLAKQIAEAAHGWGAMMWSREQDGVIRAYPNSEANRVEILEEAPTPPPEAVKAPAQSPEEGDKCRVEGCDGKYGYQPVENCSCHFNPPCSACVENPLVCLDCGDDPSVLLQPEAVKADTGAPADESGLKELGVAISALDATLKAHGHRIMIEVQPADLFRYLGYMRTLYLRPAALPTGADTASRARRVPTTIHRNTEGHRCATCDGTHAHVHGYDDQGEVPGHYDGSDWVLPKAPTPSTGSEGADTGALDLADDLDAIKLALETGTARSIKAERPIYAAAVAALARLRPLPPESSPAKGGN